MISFACMLCRETTLIKSNTLWIYVCLLFLCSIISSAANIPFLWRFTFILHHVISGLSHLMCVISQRLTIFVHVVIVKHDSWTSRCTSFSHLRCAQSIHLVRLSVFLKIHSAILGLRWLSCWSIIYRAVMIYFISLILLNWVIWTTILNSRWED